MYCRIPEMVSKKVSLIVDKLCRKNCNEDTNILFPILQLNIKALRNWYGKRNTAVVRTTEVMSVTCFTVSEPNCLTRDKNNRTSQ